MWGFLQSHKSQNVPTSGPEPEDVLADIRPMPIVQTNDTLHDIVRKHSSGVSVTAFVGGEDEEICCPKLLLVYYSSQLEELLRQSLPHRNTIRLPDHDPEVYFNLTFWMRNGNIDELRIRDPAADDGARHVICRSLVRLWVLVDAMKIKVSTHPSIFDIRTQILDRFNDLLRTAKEITTLLSEDLLLEAHRTMQPTDTSPNQLWDLMISELFARFMKFPRPNPDKYKTFFLQIPMLQVELLARFREYANDSDPEDLTEVPLTRSHKAIDLRPTNRFPDTSDPFTNAETQNERPEQDLPNSQTLISQTPQDIRLKQVNHFPESRSFAPHLAMRHESLNEDRFSTGAMTLQARHGSSPVHDTEMDDEHSISDPVQQAGPLADSPRDHDAMSISESVDEETPGLELEVVPSNSQEPPVGLDSENVQASSREHTADHGDTHHDLSGLTTSDMSDSVSNAAQVIPSLPPAGRVIRGEKRKWSSSPGPDILTKREKLG